MSCRVKSRLLALVVIPCIVIATGCGQGKRKKWERLKPPPPTTSAQEFCDSLKARAYQDLRNKRILLVTDEFPHRGSIDRRILFENLLKRKFNIELLPVFDSVFYPRCIMPIMDSAIASKYGRNGKDSIIKLLNEEVNQTFKDSE